MTRVIVSRDKLVAVADAIRAKTETNKSLTLGEMPQAIVGIKTGGDTESFLISVAERTLTECSSDKITSVGDYAFNKMNKITEVNLPNVESIGQASFQACTGIQVFDFPKCKTIGVQCFASCNGGLSFSMPLLEKVSQGSLNSMTRLVSVNLPLVKTIDTQGFYFCSSLPKADFLQLDSIGQHGFNQTKMATLIIRTNAVCTLAHTNAFLNSPVVRGEGYIYVPKSLVDSYKTATNWSTYANQIRAIEDYPEITGG